MLVTDKLKIQSYYQALIDRESSYVGIFFVGVKTTSVFCIATCRARKPKFENVEFYTTFKEALDFGYRPCKICKPTENSGQAPAEVEAAITLVRDNPKHKITDEILTNNSISPHTVRRWFKRNYGITFQVFQRMYRVNNALLELKSGKNVTNSAFDSGYESLSGFGYTYKKVLGQAPIDNKENKIILISRLTTPLGPMFVCATDNGLCLLEFSDRARLETQFKDIQCLFKRRIIAGENAFIKQAKKELEQYFEGTRQAFNVALDIQGTAFQQSTWNVLLNIPYGQTTSYQQQAMTVGDINAVRAVARANSINRISIIIPCHRVLAKSGKLTGYAGGLERKRWLIDHEQANT